MRISDWSSDVCSSDLPVEPTARSKSRTTSVNCAQMISLFAFALRKSSRNPSYIYPPFGSQGNYKQIGRESRRERRGQLVYISWVAGSLNKNAHTCSESEKDHS